MASNTRNGDHIHISLESCVHRPENIIHVKTIHIFIYKKYIENTHRLVEIDGVQVQISTHPNVLHIHTTYFDNIENLSPEFLNEVKEMKEKNPEKHRFLGRRKKTPQSPEEDSEESLEGARGVPLEDGVEERKKE